MGPRRRVDSSKPPSGAALRPLRRTVPAGSLVTFYENGRWHNQVRGGGIIGLSYPTRDEAVARGRESATMRCTGHVVVNIDGSVNSTTFEGVAETTAARRPRRPVQVAVGAVSALVLVRVATRR